MASSGYNASRELVMNKVSVKLLHFENKSANHY
jgi:hypothetical protein